MLFVSVLCLVLGRVVGRAPLTRLLTKTTNKVPPLTTTHSLLAQQATHTLAGYLRPGVQVGLSSSSNPVVSSVMVL